MEKHSKLMQGPPLECRVTLNIYLVRNKNSLVFSTFSKIYDAQLSVIGLKNFLRSISLIKPFLISESYQGSVIWSKLDQKNTQISIGEKIVPEVSWRHGDLTASILQ